MRGSRNLIAMAITGLLATGLAACGGSSSNGKSSSGGGSGASSSSGSAIKGPPLKPGENPVGQQLTGKKKGGVLTEMSNGDFEHLDPGQAYYSLDYVGVYATNRPLFAYPPNSPTTVRPDFATAVPTTSNGGITDNGKTITIHVRTDVKYSPPVNRVATAQDVAFALERGGNPNVGNAYFPAYFGASSPDPIVGTTNPKYKGGPLPGIQTPNKTTIVIHLMKPGGAQAVIDALSLPLSAPLPPEFVAPLDKHSPTTYGSQYLVATGPYMFKADAKGKIQGIGYQPGKSETLVRNPNWSASSDWRPAYLDQINFNIGGDSTVIGQQVLKTSNKVQFDTVENSIVKQAYQQYPSQITFTTGSGDHYLTLDTQAGVFKNVNIRRAMYAALDRMAIVKARGGLLVAEPGTHFIYPGAVGYEQAGGAAGPDVPWNKSVTGDVAVAKKYMKAAGYPSGKYTGSATTQIVVGNGGNGPAIAQIVQNAATAIGLHAHVSLVDQATMYSKYCGVPKQEIDACPTAGWIRDFADPLSILYPTFYGPAIVPTNNSNWSQQNDPAINKAMAAAALVSDPTARAQAWANVDKMLVNNAVAVPEDFDNEPQIESKNVAGVNQLWNEGEWDLDFTSLK